MNNQNNNNSADEIKEIKELIDKQRKLIRGEKGRFVSLKKIEKQKELPLGAPTKAVFFTKEIRRYFIGDKVYFAIDDILTTASPLLGKEVIDYTKDYEKVRAMVAKKIGDVEVADAEGILRLIKEVVAIFPGPLSRWLKE